MAQARPKAARPCLSDPPPHLPGVAGDATGLGRGLALLKEPSNYPPTTPTQLRLVQR